jgi:hypothetical protein
LSGERSDESKGLMFFVGGSTGLQPGESDPSLDIGALAPASHDERYLVFKSATSLSSAV